MELRAQPGFSTQLRQRAQFATSVASLAFQEPVKFGALPDKAQDISSILSTETLPLAPQVNGFNLDRLVQSNNGSPKKPYQIRLISRRPFQVGAALTGLSALGLATPLACLSFLGVPVGLGMMGVSALGWGQTVPAHVARALKLNLQKTDPTADLPRKQSTVQTLQSQPAEKPVANRPMSPVFSALNEHLTALTDPESKPESKLENELPSSVQSDPQHPPVSGKLEQLMDEWFPPVLSTTEELQSADQDSLKNAHSKAETQTLSAFAPMIERQGLSLDALRAKLALAGERRKVEALANEALKDKREQLNQQNLADNLPATSLNDQGLQPSQALWLQNIVTAVAQDLVVEPATPDAKVLAFPHRNNRYAQLTLVAATQLLLRERELSEAKALQAKQASQRELARHDAKKTNEIRHILHETVQHQISPDGLSASRTINGQRLIQALGDPQNAYSWQHARAADMPKLLGERLPEHGAIQPFEVAQALLEQRQVRPAQHWQRVLLQIAQGDGRVPIDLEVDSIQPVSRPSLAKLDPREPIATVKVATSAATNPLTHWWRQLTARPDQSAKNGSGATALEKVFQTPVQVSRPSGDFPSLPGDVTRATVAIPAAVPASEYVRAINLPAVVGPMTLADLVTRDDQPFLSPSQKDEFDQLPQAHPVDRTRALAYLDEHVSLTADTIWRFIEGLKHQLDTNTSPHSAK